MTPLERTPTSVVDVLLSIAPVVLGGLAALSCSAIAVRWIRGLLTGDRAARVRLEARTDSPTLEMGSDEQLAQLTGAPVEWFKRTGAHRCAP